MEQFADSVGKPFTEGTCRTCRWWDSNRQEREREKPHDAACLFNAPAAKPLRPDSATWQAEPVWPRTWFFNGCGQHKPVPYYVYVKPEDQA